MRAPLEYGDNFPVPGGSWNPAVPWRFPKHEILPAQRGVLRFLIPWITLGVGLTLGVLWMSWRVEPAALRADERPDLLGERVVQPLRLHSPESPPSPKPVRSRTALG